MKVIKSIGKTYIPKRLSYARVLKSCFIVILILGIGLRFWNIDKSFYWGDEVRTSLRASGYTKEEIQQSYDGQIIDVESLRKYQFPNPEKDLNDTVKALMSRPEHPPLYYLMARFWMQGFGDSVGVIRSLSALISLIAFPAIYWLCLELFESPVVGWTAIAIIAVSPLHILYAQEARQYSLWTVAILLSSAALLRAIRLKRKIDWGIYTLTLTLGMYSHLLFAVVAIGQGLYVLTLEGLRFNKTVIRYLAAASISALTFIPWLGVMIANLAYTSAAIVEGQKDETLFYLIDRWFRNINRVFFNADLGSANSILVIFTLYCIYFLCRHTPKRVWLFLIHLIGVTALSLIVPDLILGGWRSVAIRYLIPYYLGIQIAIAYFFSTQIASLKTWKQRVWQLVLMTILLTGLITGTIQSQQEVVWSKDADKAEFYLEIAQLIDQTPRPLIISDTSPIDVLTLSYKLNPNIQLQLVNETYRPNVPDGFSNVFLLSPSDSLRKSFKKQRIYKLKLIKKLGSDLNENPHIWEVIKR